MVWTLYWTYSEEDSGDATQISAWGTFASTYTTAEMTLHHVHLWSLVDKKSHQYTLTLIHPASPMHKATRWCHECLSWADVSTSSQVNPILWRSFFTTSLQFIIDLPGLLLNPATSQCIACFGMRTSSTLVTWPSHCIPLSRITFSRRICPVLFRTSSFVALSLQVIPRMPLNHLWCAASSFLLNVTVRGHTSAPQRRVDRISASYSLSFVCRLMCYSSKPSSFCRI